jgi:hypothetical protein
VKAAKTLLETLVSQAEKRYFLGIEIELRYCMR